jgi:hypothetical protein
MADPKNEPIIFRLEQDLKYCSDIALALQGKLPPVPGMAKDEPRLNAAQAAEYKVLCEKGAFEAAERQEVGASVKHLEEVTALINRDTAHQREMLEKLKDADCDKALLQDELADARGQERRKDPAFNRMRTSCLETARKQENQK